MKVGESYMESAGGVVAVVSVTQTRTKYELAMTTDLKR
jgi:hypothetical protein